VLQENIKDNQNKIASRSFAPLNLWKPKSSADESEHYKLVKSSQVAF